MESVHRFLAIVVADLRERTRSVRFWVVLGAIVLATWKCFPSQEARYLILAVNGDERGFYSSAWIGMVLAMVGSSLLSLFGFYLVRGTLVRDIETRVWQLLVATPMTRRGFLLAKWASHMVVFALILAAGMVVGLLAQWLRAEDRHFDLVELAKPSLLLSLPALAMTAMFAVWFDLVPWLRRTAGNVLFFVLWVTMLSVPIAQLATNAESSLRSGWISDQDGFALAAREFHRVREQQTGQEQGYGFSIGRSNIKQAPVLFEWRDWQVRPMDAVGRALWLLLALLGVMAAAPLLDWAAARSEPSAKGRDMSGRQLRWLDRLLDPLARGTLAILAAAELKLALRQRRWWWWLAAVVSVGMQVSGSGKAMHVGMMLAWVLPLDVIARGILRERDHGTSALVFTAPGILPRLLVARLLVGVCLLLALTLPGALRLLPVAPVAALAVLLVDLSIVSWGLCLGALFRNARPFELLLVATAYAGLQGAALFDLGQTPQQTALWHGLALLPAWLVLAWAWPRLARSPARAG